MKRLHEVKEKTWSIKLRNSTKTKQLSSEYQVCEYTT